MMTLISQKEPARALAKNSFSSSVAWMPVWCTMAQRSALPCPRISPLGPGPARLGSPGPKSSGGCGDGAEPRAASRAVPQDPPPARPAPGGRGRQRRALVPRVRAAGAGVWIAQCWASVTFLAKKGPPSDVSVVTCRPRSWRTVGGCALGCGRDCALTAEKV